MWPWEHLAVGYVCYSAFTRYRYGRSPTDLPVLLLVLATQLPDLIDKPLAWGLELLPSGRSLGHSLLFALPATLAAVVALGRRLGVAFAIGYGSHLAADVVGYWLLRGEHSYAFLVWPLIEQPATDTPGLLFRADRFLTLFVEFLASPEGQLYLAMEIALIVGAVLLWISDGSPGAPPLRPEQS